jgi:hypothetical protein
VAWFAQPSNPWWHSRLIPALRPTNIPKLRLYGKKKSIGRLVHTYVWNSRINSGSCAHTIAIGTLAFQHTMETTNRELKAGTSASRNDLNIRWVWVICVTLQRMLRMS